MKSKVIESFKHPPLPLKRIEKSVPTWKKEKFIPY